MDGTDGTATPRRDDGLSETSAWEPGRLGPDVPPRTATPQPARRAQAPPRAPHAPAPPYAGPAAPPPAFAHPRGPVHGQVRGLQSRTESYGNGDSRTVLSFRIERYDAAGNRLRPVSAQLRGIAYDGVIHEGDEVRVDGTWRDGTLHAERVVNLSTHSTLKPKSFRNQLIAFLAVVAVLIIGAVIFVMQADAAFENETNQNHQENHQEFCQQAEELTGSAPPGC